MTLSAGEYARITSRCAIWLISGTLLVRRYRDPATLLAVSALLIAAALLASCLPTRRTTSVDLILAQRDE